MPHEVDMPLGRRRSPLSRIGPKTRSAIALLGVAALAYYSLVLAIVLVVLAALGFALLVRSSYNLRRLTQTDETRTASLIIASRMAADQVRGASGRARSLIPVLIYLLFFGGFIAYAASQHSGSTNSPECSAITSAFDTWLRDSNGVSQSAMLYPAQQFDDVVSRYSDAPARQLSQRLKQLETAVQAAVPNEDQVSAANFAVQDAENQLGC